MSIIRPLPESTVELSTIPECDICKHVDKSPAPLPAIVDGPTLNGSWGYMCEQHYQTDARPMAELIGSHLVPVTPKTKMKGE